MAIKRENSRISVLLTHEEWKYLYDKADWECTTMSKYLQSLLHKDMAQQDKFDDPKYLIDTIQFLLNELRAKSNELTVNEDWPEEINL